MAAEFKSHVLLRDEKGFAGIAFKRLILAGVGGGLRYSICRLPLPDYALLLGAPVALILLVVTGTRGGLPLWQRLLYRLRGEMLLAATRKPAGWIGQLARALELPVDLVRLDAATVFAPPQGDLALDMREWITFASAAESDRDDGLRLFDAPSLEIADE